MKILGFDLGDGESAVTLLDEDSTVEPRVLPLSGRNSLLSAVGVKNGRIVIGEEASVTDGAAEAKVRFKSRYLTDPSASADVRAFAQGVMNELTRTQPGADGRGQPNGGRLSGRAGATDGGSNTPRCWNRRASPTSASCRSRAPRFSMRATRAACASARN